MAAYSAGDTVERAVGSVHVFVTVLRELLTVYNAEDSVKRAAGTGGRVKCW